MAESILHYARGNAMSAVVLGSRGMGSMRSGMMAFLGLGSVSLYIAHHFDRRGQDPLWAALHTFRPMPVICRGKCPPAQRDPSVSSVDQAVRRRTICRFLQPDDLRATCFSQARHHLQAP